MGTEIDTELSAEYFKKAYSGFLLIEKNTDNADLQYRFGVMALKGIGCEADIFEAAEFFIKSADNGNVHAAYRLGKIYLSDDLKNLELAEKYLKIAAEKDDPYAMYSLTKLYLDGEIPMRRDKAISLLIDLQPKCNKIHKKLRSNSAGERKPKRFLGRLLIRSTTV